MLPWHKYKFVNLSIRFCSSTYSSYHCCDWLVWTKIREMHSIYYVFIQLQREKRRKKKKHYNNINFGCDWGLIKNLKKISPSSQAFVNGLLHQKECLFSWRIKIIARDGGMPSNWTPSVPVCRGSKTCTEIEETGDDLRRRRRKLEPMAMN